MLPAEGGSLRSEAPGKELRALGAVAACAAPAGANSSDT